jgi:predicted dehydrogenase
MGIAGMSSDHVWFMGDGLAALPDVDLVTAAEAYPELRQQGVERWGFKTTYPDVQSMLASEQLDAILICSDNRSKADIVEAAAARKIHVYSDKPMGATLAQAQRSWQAAQAAGITYMVAYHSAFSSTYEHSKRLLQAGAIGKPYLARGVIGHGGPIEYGCSRYFTEWLFDAERNGGGTLIDEGCYLIDEFVDILGDVAEVNAFTAHIGYRDYLPSDMEDNAVVILRFASGALGIIDSKWGQVGPAPVRTSYHGDKGTLTVGLRAVSVELYTTVTPPPAVPSEWQPLTLEAGDVHSPVPPGLRGWQACRSAESRRDGKEERYFVDRAQAHAPIEGAASPATALKAQAVIEAAYLSARNGCAVKLPLLADGRR